MMETELEWRAAQQVTALMEQVVPAVRATLTHYIRGNQKAHFNRAMAAVEGMRKCMKVMK